MPVCGTATLQDSGGKPMKKCLRISIRGRVQGVGFRPTVYRYASQLGLAGHVKNMPWGVAIGAEGEEEKLSAFVERLRESPPRQARIDAIEVQEAPLSGGHGFEIVSSQRSGDVVAGMPPDLATCDECRRELFDAADRRFGYPFLNCVNCGPRFTIIRELPYDRENTSMAAFTQCADCQGEYEDPANRRFDAQPNACGRCGPALSLVEVSGRAVEGDALEQAASLLAEGKIVAVKGLGGYHLCCDAANDETVRKLRRLKNRPAKAFAVMFSSMGQMREHCDVGSHEERELESCAGPIVIVPRRRASALSSLISPDTGDIGAFLPCTPLHHLLLCRMGPLVMTSGNFADEPIAKEEGQLGRILGPVADFALVHNRPILRRCDDSVLRMVDGQRLFVRRSRGFVPDPIALGLDGPPVLAVGAELKNTFCVSRGAQAFVSQHIGDLSEHANFEFFREALQDFAELLGVRPRIVACDLHPDYPSTRYAESLAAEKKEQIQHHHAHIAGCMAEHGITRRVIGVALDGSGAGPDGTVWGGEFMVADLQSFERFGHFKEYRLVGGDEAIRHPIRMALSCVASELGGEVGMLRERMFAALSDEEIEVLLQMARTGVRSPMTSSCGRLFDAVAAMLGVCDTISYEGQAAIRLQHVARRGEQQRYEFEIETKNDVEILSFAPMIRSIVADCVVGKDKGEVAAMFHNTVSHAVCEMCERIRAATGIESVVLSGGVFQNDLLLRLISTGLKRCGFAAYSNHAVPPNDAGVSLGQAAVALARNA